MYLVDTKTRRAWPPYWANHRLKAIREKVVKELSARATPLETGGDALSPACAATTTQGSEREIRLETERRWREFCLSPQDLAAYREEVLATGPM